MNSEFPQLERKINGKKLIYLDSAATTLMPKQVEEIIHTHNTLCRANVHRSASTLSAEASEAYEGARQNVADFIRAKTQEIVFTKNATEAFNLLAYTLLEDSEEGDEIVLTVTEHHSNIVPWQQIAKRKGVTIKFIQITEEGALDINQAREIIGEKTIILAVTHMSNVLGRVNPIKKLADLAHEQGAVIVVDGAQSTAHIPIDVQKLDCDFFVFSGHKIYGPTGIGVLYGREEHLKNMEPFLYGGDMIEEVSLEESTWNEIPWKFEAGTPPIAQAIGLGEATKYLQEQFENELEKKEDEIMQYALDELQKIEGIHIYGAKNSIEHKGAVSFTVKGIHPHDGVTLMDREGIQIRGGNHCAEPLSKVLGIQGGSMRLSIGTYTTISDIDAVIPGIKKMQELFKDKGTNK